MNILRIRFSRHALCVIATLLVFPVFLNGAQESVIDEQPRSDQSVEAFKRSIPRITQRLNKLGLTFGSPIFIRIFKDSKELEVWIESKPDEYKLFKNYAICHHSGELGPKLQEGDRQSPEGFYQISRSQMNPWSNFHLAFDLGYPNDYDQAHRRTGGELMIHGRCSSIGCFAMTDYYMDEIYTLADAALASGQNSFQVHIFPFRLSRDNLARHSNARWYKFWLELEPGYTYFETTRLPPRVDVRKDKYRIRPIASSSIAGNGVSEKTATPSFSTAPVHN